MGLQAWTSYRHFLGTVAGKSYTTGHTKAFHSLFLLPPETPLTEKGNDFAHTVLTCLLAF